MSDGAHRSAPREARGAAARRRVVPGATYRLQLRTGFGFAGAAAIAPYLARLGVSHVYTSPILQAASGSAHGYDVVDPRLVNGELGGSRGLQRFSRVLGDHGLGQVLDIVPNHMAIPGGENPWWWDVLENGQASRYARYFDVDWDPPEAYLRNLVLVPILGDHYGRVLEAGELRLERAGPAFRVRYHEHVLPVAAPSVSGLMATAAARVRSDELAFLADVAERLPPATAVDRASTLRRDRDLAVLRRQLGRLLEEEPRVARAVDDVVAETNADPDALDAILGRQSYRLAHWRAAGRDLGYRRFFDVATLIGLRVEDEVVFADTHRLLLRWLAAGVLDGLRVDHPDGLRDPREYLDRLRAATPRGWLVVEKIVEGDESLRPDWPVDGTTGYEFLNLVTGLLVDPAGAAPLGELAARMTGDPRPFPEIARECRLLVLHETLGSELNRLTALFLEICEGHRRHRDYTRHELHEALRELAASMPVYRTYARAATGEIAAEDEAVIASAVAVAATARPDLDPDLFALLGDILALRVRGPLEGDLVMRFQQLTGAVMAKGVEDTAFYRDLRLLALNEVGGDPGRFGVSPDAFHQANAERQMRWPSSMLTTSTHDTKRGEDVRARLVVLSETAEAWAAAVERWHALLAHGARGRPRADRLDRGTEYLLFQTVVGAWPIDEERLLAYMVKATREAKLRTSWTAPDARFEGALARAVRRMLGHPELRADMEAYIGPVIAAGRVASLAQALLRLTSPGVPDTYQGSELWDLSLVDPDNRRPVDFALRDRLLGELEAGMSPEAILERADEGLPKLWTVHRALRLRRERPECFDVRGSYRPLIATGPEAHRAVAFLRGDGAITVVPRLVAGGVSWRSTALDLPAGRWLDRLSGQVHRGGRVRIATILGRFPVALLAREDPQAARGIDDGGSS